MQTTEVTEFSAEALISNLENLRANAPLVQNITNFVVMQQTANALLAIGASPVMAHAKDELAELAVIAQSLVINIGTLDEHWISSMLQAAKIAKKNKIPASLCLLVKISPNRPYADHNLCFGNHIRWNNLSSAQ